MTNMRYGPNRPKTTYWEFKMFPFFIWPQVLSFACLVRHFFLFKLKFDHEFKAHWSFCSDLKVLIESKYSMPWVRCAFGNVLWSILGGGCIEIQHQELLRLFWCCNAFFLNNLSLTNGRLGQQQTCASTYTRRGGPPSGRTAPPPAAGTWKYYFRQNLLQLDKGQICRKRPQIFLSMISKRRNHAWSFFCPLYFYEMMRSPIADGVNYELKQINWLRYQIIIKCQLRTKYSDWNWYNFDLDNQICNTFHNNAWRIHD